MRRALPTLIAIVVLVTACGGGEDVTSSDEYRALQVQVQQAADQAQADIDERDATIERLTEERDAEANRAYALEANLTQVEGELDTAQQVRDTAISEKDAALEERDAAVADRDAVMLRFDPQIQAAVATAQADAEAAACAQGTMAGRSGADLPAVDAIVNPVLAGLPDGATVDEAVIRTRLEECRAAGATEAEAAAHQARLTEPKGSGVYVVGEDIAAGRWRNMGSSSDGSCYYKRMPYGQADEIVDNGLDHGGTVITINEGEMVEFNRCGPWEFQG